MEKEQDRNPASSSRRSFLHACAAGAVAGVASKALAQTPVPSAVPAIRIASSALDEISLTALQGGFHSGKFTAHAVAQQYLTRIDEIDKHGPAVNSVIELNPDALDIADQLDRERKTQGPRSPLHGVPVLLKDNIATADRMTTTAGSLALAGSIAARDSFVAQQLRKAGAVILGKTNLSEWANIRSARSTSGWSGRGGQTKNPYALDRNPCGSSSGSGVAVSANLCALAVGTETDGSIVCPSAVNGIVGIKPTVGLVSRSGIIPIAHSQDTAGPMARTVADAAALLTVLAGIDPDDRATASAQGKIAPDYTRFCDANGLRGARIGVVRKYCGFNDAIDRMTEDLLDQMRHAGAEIIDPADVPTIGKFDDSELSVLLYELKADLNAYLAALGPGAPAHTLKDVIDFNDQNRQQEMPYFGQDLFLLAQEKEPLTTPEYLQALEANHRMTRQEGIDAVMDKLQLDALFAPTGGAAWTTDWVNGDHTTGGSSSAAAVAGYPNINVPAGFVFGLPVGMSFFGRAFSEATLIKVAYAFEQLVRARKPPEFLPTVEFRV